MRNLLFLLTVSTFITLTAAEFTGTSTTLPNGTLQIIQVDTGDTVGDAYIIRTPQNKIFLLDTGDFGTAEQFLIPALEKHGISRIDTVILTHFHSDHTAGLFDLLNDINFEIGEILYSCMPENEIPGSYTKTMFRRIMSMAERNHVPVKLITTGETIDFGGGITAYICGSATAGSRNRDLNGHSLVFKLVYKEFTALFTGDCSFVQERAILATGYDLKCDLLKVGHHAGAGSTGEAWLDAISPQVAIACMPQWLSLDERGKRVEAMLKARNIPFFRSWEFPDAIIYSDGNTFGIYTGK